MTHWDCSVEQQRTLLGAVSNTTLYKYRRTPDIRLPHDTLERISHLMGIHKSLSIIFSNQRLCAPTLIRS